MKDYYQWIGNDKLTDIEMVKLFDSCLIELVSLLKGSKNRLKTASMYRRRGRKGRRSSNSTMPSRFRLFSDIISHGSDRGSHSSLRRGSIAKNMFKIEMTDDISTFDAISI